MGQWPFVMSAYPPLILDESLTASQHTNIHTILASGVRSSGQIRDASDADMEHTQTLARDITKYFSDYSQDMLSNVSNYNNSWKTMIRRKKITFIFLCIFEN